MLKKLCFIIVVCCLGSQLFAQEIKAYVNKESLTTDEVLELSVELSGINGRVSTPAFPQIKGFRAMGISTQQRYNSFSGASFIFSRTYQPTRAGTFTIPSFSYSAGGVGYKTPTFKIKVSKGTGKPKQNRGRRDPLADFFDSDPFADDFFKDPFGSRKRDLKFQETNADYFLSLNLNKEECYLGEQLLCEVTLYINYADQRKIGVNTQEIQEMAQRIKNTQFWEEQLDLREIKPKLTTVNNKRYVTYTLYRTVLFPIASGDIKMSKVYLEAQKALVATNASIMDRFSGSDVKYKPIKVYAPDKTIKVNPLPTTSLPNASSVGKFDIDASINKQTPATGEDVEIKVTIKGNGNIAMLPSPEMQIPESIRSYDPATDYKINKSSHSVSGEKTFTFNIIPTKGGSYTIGPAKFYYFKPESSEYDSLVTQPFEITVTGEDLDNLVLKNSGLDSFYQVAMEDAGTHVPSRFPYKPVSVLSIILLLSALIIYSRFRAKRMLKAENS